MRAALVLLSALALSGCNDPLSDWSADGNSAVAEAELGELPSISARGETKRLLSSAPEVANLTIRYFGTVEGDLGNEEPALFFTASFDGKEVARTNFENLDMYEAADLAKAVTLEAGQGGVVLASDCPFTQPVCDDALKQPERP